VNLFGTHGVAYALLPHLTRSHGPSSTICRLAPSLPSTQSLRAAAAGRGVRVHAVFTAMVDTDMTSSVDMPKADPGSPPLATNWRDGAAEACERQLAALEQGIANETR
jgi:hypothetical protein